MRTTITIDDKLIKSLKEAAYERGLSLSQGIEGPRLKITRCAFVGTHLFFVPNVGDQ